MTPASTPQAQTDANGTHLGVAGTQLHADRRAQQRMRQPNAGRARSRDAARAMGRDDDSPANALPHAGSLGVTSELWRMDCPGPPGALKQPQHFPQ